MLISDTSFQCHSLFDCNITNMKNNQTFGSQFIEDKASTSIYTYRTLQRTRNSIRNGILFVVSKLDQLHDSLYDMLIEKHYQQMYQNTVNYQQYQYSLNLIQNKQLYHLYFNKIQ